MCCGCAKCRRPMRQAEDLDLTQDRRRVYFGSVFSTPDDEALPRDRQEKTTSLTIIMSHPPSRNDSISVRRDLSCLKILKPQRSNEGMIVCALATLLCPVQAHVPKYSSKFQRVKIVSIDLCFRDPFCCRDKMLYWWPRRTIHRQPFCFRGKLLCQSF